VPHFCPLLAEVGILILKLLLICRPTTDYANETADEFTRRQPQSGERMHHSARRVAHPFNRWHKQTAGAPFLALFARGGYDAAEAVSL